MPETLTPEAQRLVEVGTELQRAAGEVSDVRVDEIRTQYVESLNVRTAREAEKQLRELKVHIDTHKQLVAVRKDVEQRAGRRTEADKMQQILNKLTELNISVEKKIESANGLVSYADAVQENVFERPMDAINGMRIGNWQAGKTLTTILAATGIVALGRWAFGKTSVRTNPTTGAVEGQQSRWERLKSRTLMIGGTLVVGALAALGIKWAINRKEERQNQTPPTTLNTIPSLNQAIENVMRPGSRMRVSFGLTEKVRLPDGRELPQNPTSDREAAEINGVSYEVVKVTEGGVEKRVLIVTAPDAAKMARLNYEPKGYKTKFTVNGVEYRLSVGDQREADPNTISSLRGKVDTSVPNAETRLNAISINDESTIQVLDEASGRLLTTISRAANPGDAVIATGVPGMDLVLDRTPTPRLRTTGVTPGQSIVIKATDRTSTRAMTMDMESGGASDVSLNGVDANKMLRVGANAESRNVLTGYDPANPKEIKIGGTVLSVPGPTTVPSSVTGFEGCQLEATIETAAAPRGPGTPPETFLKLKPVVPPSPGGAPLRKPYWTLWIDGKVNYVLVN